MNESTNDTKYLREHIKGGKIYLTHSVRGFSLWFLGSVVLGPMVRHNIMAAEACGTGGRSPHGRQEEETRDQTMLSKSCPLPSHDLLPSIGPTP
jgi:hypothetical protein